VANASPDYLVENHIVLEVMLVIPPLLLRTIPAGDIVAQLVADNDKETRAETTVTGTTESPSVIIFGRRKGSTMAQ